MQSSGPIPEPNIDALRQRLRQLRHERGWSYDRLAAESGLGRATLVALESGNARRDRDGVPGMRPQSEGTIRTWYLVARAFGISLSEFVEALD